MAFKALFFLFAVLAPGALGYSSGAPDDACRDMVPQHHTPPQTGDAPYTLTLSRRMVRQGDQVQLTIRGKSKDDKIRGFMVQARQGEKAVGSFLVNNKDSFVQTLKCGDGTDNAVTHQSHEESEDKRELVLTWLAPKQGKMTVNFRATIALNGGIFWVAVPSDNLQIF